MTIFLPQYFELLKQAVLQKAGFSTVSPSDCRSISILIYDITKFSVSETTLKRVFGFAYSKFRPSLFTIDAMAKYCGFNNWEDFCVKHEPRMESSAKTNANWETLKHNAGKITGFTLQTLKNKSGIPYHQTIKRQSVDFHIDEFLAGDYTATVLAAPAGYGKTLALCHWVEERLEDNATGKSNDILLFFSSSALMNVFLSGRDLNYWILGLLGFSTEDDLSTLANHNGKQSGNFYLIIDGLDEFAYKAEQFRLLLNQVRDLFALYQGKCWFKMILTMRSATWLNHRHDLESDHDRWFTGFIADENLALNVPLFSLHEIKELCNKINPNAQHTMAADVAESFNHPLYFQFYYKEYKNDFSLGNVDHVSLHELVSNFVLNKVHLGHYSAEKLLLLNGLVEQMDLPNNQFDPDRLKVNGLIKQYPQAYQDLISIGFLREVNSSTDVQYKTVIKFGNCNFMDFTVAKYLLLKNDYAFDEKLIDILNTRLATSQRKLHILKWWVIYAVKTGQQRSFDLFARVDLTPKQKSELLIFLGELLEKSTSPLKGNESMIQFFTQDCSDDLFNYFFGLEFISTGYKKTLQTLLKFELCSNKRILVHTALACVAVMQLDVTALKLQLDNLKSFNPEDFRHYAINPLNCVDTLYQFFAHGIINLPFFRELTEFCFNPPSKGEGVIAKQASDIIFLISGYTLSICRRPRKSLRYFDILEKRYESFNTPSPVYKFLLDMIRADANFMLGNRAEVIRLHNSAQEIYEVGESSFTAFMRGIMYALKIKIAILERNLPTIAANMKLLTAISEETGARLSKLFVLLYILNRSNVADLDPQLYKQAVYDYNKKLRECGLRAEIFSSPELVN